MGFKADSGETSSGRGANRRGIRELLHDRTFWAVQGLVLLIAIIHTIIDARIEIHHPSYLYLLPISAFFVPVLYAAVTFGVVGTTPTALFSALLTAPNIIIFNRGSERIGVVAQFALLFVLGLVVGFRVDRERQAKSAAEAANRSLAEIQKSLENYIGMAIRAQEEERHRLSRELHDETIQDLVMMKVALEALSSDTDPRSRIKTLDEELQRCIDGIRHLCRALRPSLLDDLGLLPALESLVAEMNARTESHTSLNVLGIPIQLSTDKELAIFRIVQEALRNVERHTEASQISVRLTYRPDGLRLEIQDDGAGFQRDSDQRMEGGLGLAGMQERARLIGAVLQIASEPGGTRVVLDLPTRLKADATDQSEARISSLVDQN